MIPMLKEEADEGASGKEEEDPKRRLRRIRKGIGGG